jgi:cytochrome c-type biogenesis protein CcmH/NrfG
VPDAQVEIDPEVAENIRQTAARAREHPEDPESWLRLGLVYLAHHMYPLAAQSLDRAVALAPDAARARYLRGVARM